MERREVSLQLWAKLSNSSSFSDMESCNKIDLWKWFGKIEIQNSGQRADINLVWVDVEILTWRPTLHTLDNCHLLHTFDSYHLPLPNHLSHPTYPDDKVIPDSGTIECVDGDDFSPTWYVSELQLLGDEFCIVCYWEFFSGSWDLTLRDNNTPTRSRTMGHWQLEAENLNHQVNSTQVTNMNPIPFCSRWLQSVWLFDFHEEQSLLCCTHFPVNQILQVSAF